MEILQVLLEAGSGEAAAVDMPNNNGQTPLHLAILTHNRIREVEKLQALLKARPGAVEG